MAYTKESILEGVNTKNLAQFIGLASLSLAIPALIHIQWVSGPLVNALLIITLFLSGIRSALILSMVPSLMALASGLLPAVLAPAVPFIMFSNAILVLSIDQVYFRLKNNTNAYFGGLLLGAFLKFIFLYFSISVVTDLLIKQELAAKVAQLFSWTQFVTALTGGLLAFAFLRWLKRL